MSEANGHSLSLHEVREQIELFRAKRELRHLQLQEGLSGRLLENTYMGFSGNQWGDFVDPMDAFRDSDLRVTPLGGAARHDRRDGFNRPFVWTEFDGDIIRSQARWIATRNLLGVGAVKCLGDYTARKGFTYEAKPAKRFATDAVALELTKQVQEVLEEFQSFNTVERLGEQHTWAFRERECVTKSVVDGEVFVRTFDQKDDGLTLVRFIEPEQIRQPLGSPPAYTQGILTDEADIERPLEYAVAYTHPNDWEGVPASEVSHLKLNVPTCVKRGLSDFYPGAELFDDTRKMLRNMVITGGVQAAIAWIEQFDQATASALQAHVQAARDQQRPDFARPFTGRAINYQKMEPGSIPKVGAGREYIPQPTAVNSASHTTTVQAGMRAMGARWNMPEYMISGDASNANYSSTLVSGAPFVVGIECNQALRYGPFFVRVMWQGPIRNAARWGRFKVGGRRYTYEEVSRYVDVMPTPPEVAIADPSRDGQIDHQDIAAGVMSIQTRRARRGLDDATEEHNLKEKPPKQSGGGGQPPDGPPAGGDGNDLAAMFGEAMKRRPDLARQLREELKIGKDKRGRRYCTEDGKRVDCPPDAGEGGSDQHGPPSKHAGQKKGLAGLLAAGKAGAGRMLRKLKVDWLRGTTPQLRTALKRTGKAIAAVEHGLNSLKHASQEMVGQVAKERGLDEKQAARVQKIAKVADAVSAWTANVPLGHAALHTVGIHGGAGMLLSKLAFYVPVGSLAYLAYSTARNPLATARAARAVMAGKGKVHESHQPDEGKITPDVAGALADGVKGATDPEWYQALVMAGLDDGDLEAAVMGADQAIARQPRGPTAPDGEEDQDWLASLWQGRQARESLDVEPSALQEAMWLHYHSDLLEAREKGVPFQGPSGRWFVVNEKGRTVPSKAPGSTDKSNKVARRASAEEVSSHIQNLKSGEVTAGHIAEAVEMLERLTVDELRQVNKTLQTKAGSSKTRAALVAKIKERALGAKASKASPADGANGTASNPNEAANGTGSGRDSERGRSPGDGGDDGNDAEAGGSVAGEAGRSGAAGGDQGGQGGDKPDDNRTAGRVPADIKEVNRRLDRYEKLFRARGQHQQAEWMGKLREHINAVGGEAALAALGEDRGEGDGRQVGYAESEYWESMGAFVGSYLDRHGIVPVASVRDPSALKVSPFTTEYTDFKPDVAPTETIYNDKLEESKDLPGLESSEDIHVIMGRDTPNLTPDVIAKLDERYGKDQWIVKTYSEENAFAGFGVYFPQRAERIKQDAQSTIWAAGEHLSKYGFRLGRNKDGEVFGLVHETGDIYQFGTEEYEKTIDGDAREWAEKARGAAMHEKGMALPHGGKKFMAQPAFPVVGVSEADRAAGKTWEGNGEGRVHVTTRGGKVAVIPHSTWIKGEPLPVVFENDDTRAMAKAAEDAINALPEAARKGQLFSPDIVRTKDGYRVVELNASVDGGGSGYLMDNPFIIDSYVSHVTSREPAHVRFIRKLLTAKKKAGKGAQDASDS